VVHVVTVGDVTRPSAVTLLEVRLLLVVGVYIVMVGINTIVIALVRC
jgi:hypothetical protein